MYNRLRTNKKAHFLKLWIFVILDITKISGHGLVSTYLDQILRYISCIGVWFVVDQKIAYTHIHWGENIGRDNGLNPSIIDTKQQFNYLGNEITLRIIKIRFGISCHYSTLYSSSSTTYLHISSTSITSLTLLIRHSRKETSYLVCPKTYTKTLVIEMHFCSQTKFTHPAFKWYLRSVEE